MWTGDIPFSNYEMNYEVIAAVRSGERPPVPRDCPSEYGNLMTACWVSNPTQRPTFPHIVQRLAEIIAQERTGCV